MFARQFEMPQNRSVRTLRAPAPGDAPVAPPPWPPLPHPCSSWRP